MAAFARRLLLLALAAGCSSRGGAGGEPQGPVPPLPKNPNPPPPLGAEPPPAPGAPGLVWLERVHARFHEGWAEGFLEHTRVYLEVDHPLNDFSLRATVRFAVDADGHLKDVDLAASSGNKDFDAAALEVVRESAPLPPPPSVLRSDDGWWYVEWSFHRDARQDGIASAKVDKREWDPRKAVPALLAKGDVGEAARRVAEATSAHGDPQALSLAGEVALGALTLALGDESDPQARVEGARVLGKTGATTVLGRLRRLAREAPDLALQRAAIQALGDLGDPEAVPVMLAALQTVDGERSVAAAQALARLGRRKAAWDVLAARLEETDGRVRASVLATLGALGAPESRPALAGLLAHKSTPRAERVAAALALGGVAASEGGGEAARALVAALADGEAAVRAAAAWGLARAGKLGVASRPLARRAASLFKDRDPKVRAAAVAAVAALSPSPPAAELVALARREGDVGVLVELAGALAKVPGPEPKRTVEGFAVSSQPEVRLAALRALSARGESDGRQMVASLVGDPSPEVRAVAYDSQSDPAQIVAGFADEAPQVRAAAVRAHLRLAGLAGGAPAAFRALAEASSSRERVLLAEVWFDAARAK